MKSYLIGVVVVGTLLSISGFVLRDNDGSKYEPADGLAPPGPVAPAPQPPPRDAYGCDTPGGFVWCEPSQKCLQLWVEQCTGVVPATSSPSGKAL